MNYWCFQSNVNGFGSITDQFKTYSIIKVLFDHFYNTQSGGDKCTLYQEKQMLNRRNVVSDVKTKYNACKQFTELAIDARLVAAGLKVLEIDAIDDIPSGE